jgi:hypothetical protein
MNKIKHFFGQQHVLTMPARLKQIFGLLNREELLTLVEDLKRLITIAEDQDFVIVGSSRQEELIS